MDTTDYTPLTPAEWATVHDDSQRALHPDVTALRAEFDALLAAYRAMLNDAAVGRVMMPLAEAKLAAFAFKYSDAITFRLTTTPASGDDNGERRGA